MKGKLFKLCYSWFTSKKEENSHTEEFSLWAEGCCVKTLRHHSNIKENYCYKQVICYIESILFAVIIHKQVVFLLICSPFKIVGLNIFLSLW